MTKFVHLLTAAAIFVHATVGCCVHEAHGMDGECCEPIDCSGAENHDHSIEAELPAARSCSSALELSSTFGQQPQQPSPHECHHADCQWPTPEVQDSVDLMLLDFAGGVPWSLGISLVPLLANGSDSPFLLPHSSPHTVPVRTHLTKCVLII